MRNILPDILRGAVSDVMLLLLMFSLARPKYRRWTYALLILVFVLLDAVLDAFLYARGAYTEVVYLSAFLSVPVLFLSKPLFQEGMMQWCFNVITMMNVFVMTLFLSYHLAHLLPFPEYADTAFRAVILSGVIFLFLRYLRPLYLRVVDHWRYYFLTAFSLFACFVYIMGFTGGAEQALQRQAIPLTLLSIATICAYSSIFWSLKSVSQEYAQRERAVRADARQELLRAELDANSEFLETARQNRHDLRHHNALLLEYLQLGDIDGAQEYLKQYDSGIAAAALPQYCVHPVANVVLRVFARRCEKAGVAYQVTAEIPGNLPLSSPELDIVLSNVLENALNAATGASDAFLSVQSRCDEGNLCLVVENSAPVQPLFQNGLPVSVRPGGGTGMKSVLAAVKNHGGMLRCKWLDGTFSTQLILPL